MKTECDYLNGWIKKQSHTQKSHPKVVNPRDIAGEHKKKTPKKQKEKSKKANDGVSICNLHSCSIFVSLCRNRSRCTSYFFFFNNRWPSRSDLQSCWCHKTSRLVEVICRAPQPVARSAPCGHDSWHLSVYFGQDSRTWSGVWSACPNSHTKVSEMPILFRWALRPECPVRRRKIVVYWARSSLQIGSRCAWYPPFFFLPVSIVPRVEKCLGLSVGERILCLRSLHWTESGEVSCTAYE